MIVEKKPHIKATLEAIVSSSAVTEYVIGLTAVPEQRRSSYRNTWIQYPHFAILSANLNSLAALKLEEELQAYAHRDETSPMSKKYEPARRFASYRAGLGGTKKYVNSNDYCVYIAWK